MLAGVGVYLDVLRSFPRPPHASRAAAVLRRRRSRRERFQARHTRAGRGQGCTPLLLPPHA